MCFPLLLFNLQTSTASFTVPTNSSIIEESLNQLLIPEQSKCGRNNVSPCSSALKVLPFGSDMFFVFFVGERLDRNIELELNTEGLINYKPEIFNNSTNNAIHLNSGVAYVNVNELNVFMGRQDIVANIRGTSALTRVETQGGDDSFFVGSDANESIETANSVDVLFGVLDYIERDLEIFANGGHHRLFISDMFSTIVKGTGERGRIELTHNILSNLADDLGDIYFSVSENGNWLGGINIWLGSGGDRMDVTSIPSSSTGRTTTSVHCGSGDDVVSIDLESNANALFIANGQGGDDVLDASSSSLPVILFGDGGNDKLDGSSAEDVLIGDFGLVLWIDETGAEVARGGGGGYGDFTDGMVRQISQIVAVTSPIFDSGNDTIYGHEGRDAIFGCGGQMDTIYGNEGADFLFGDFGEINFDPNAPNGNLFGILSMTSFNCTHGDSNFIYGNDGNGKCCLSTLCVGCSFGVSHIICLSAVCCVPASYYDWWRRKLQLHGRR